MYNVIVLAEQAMSTSDAAEVASLHESIEDRRHYHVLIPCENAAVRVETALGTLAASEVLATPPPVLTGDVDVEKAQNQIDEHAETDVSISIAAMRKIGCEATGEFSADDPIEALDRVVGEQQAAEVIVMTRQHVISELLHVDWASKARRRLGVPILHLIEHESLDAEAGAGEGVTGM
ncbi:MAG: hypothetical protein ACR2KG_01915 [Nocardioidaceae bacterium]